METVGLRGQEHPGDRKLPTGNAFPDAVNMWRVKTTALQCSAVQCRAGQLSHVPRDFRKSAAGSSLVESAVHVD